MTLSMEDVLKKVIRERRHAAYVMLLFAVLLGICVWLFSISAPGFSSVLMFGATLCTAAGFLFAAGVFAAFKDLKYDLKYFIVKGQALDAMHKGMRSRHEIAKAEKKILTEGILIHDSDFLHQQDLILEVLLDIRDVLQPLADPLPPKEES